MNSYSSLLSYNNFDFNLILEDESTNDVMEEKKNDYEDQDGQKIVNYQIHEPTFMKQLVYFIIILSLYVRYVNFS